MVADPGFPLGGGPNIQFSQIFPKKIYEIERIWTLTDTDIDADIDTNPDHFPYFFFIKCIQTIRFLIVLLFFFNVGVSMCSKNNH